MLRVLRWYRLTVPEASLFRFSYATLALLLVLDIVSKVSVLSFNYDTITAYRKYFGNSITMNDNSITIR